MRTATQSHQIKNHLSSVKRMGKPFFSTISKKRGKEKANLKHKIPSFPFLESLWKLSYSKLIEQTKEINITDNPYATRNERLSLGYANKAITLIDKNLKNRWLSPLEKIIQLYEAKYILEDSSNPYTQRSLLEKKEISEACHDEPELKKYLEDKYQEEFQQHIRKINLSNAIEIVIMNLQSASQPNTKKSNKIVAL